MLAAAAFGACSHSVAHDHDDVHAHENTENHQHDHEPVDDHDHDHDHNHESDGHGAAEAAEKEHSFGSEIVLKPEVAVRFGVKSDTIAAGSFCNVVRASGVVLQSPGETAVVASPLSGTVRLAHGLELGSEVHAGSAIAVIDASAVAGGNAALASAAALKAAEDEYVRVKALYSERLATAGELNAARAAYEQARAVHSPRAAAGNAVSPIGGTVTAINVASGEFVEAGAPLATVASARNITLRIDLPQKYYAASSSFSDAVIEMPYSQSSFAVSEKGGKRTGGSAMSGTGAAAAYVPVYFSLPNDGSLQPGAAFTAYLLGSRRQGVVSVPLEALVEQQGQFFLYRRLDKECYERVAVTVGDRDGRRAEILRGVSPGDVIVTSGATTVRLAESGSAIPEGHSHNH